MPIANATRARAYVQNADISADLMQIDMEPTTQVQDVTTFGTGVTGKSYAATLTAARLTADGFFSTDLANGIDARMAALLGTKVQIGLWPAGDAAGARGWADDDAVFVQYKPTAKVGSVVGVHAEWECSGGPEPVTSISPKATTAGAATATTTAVDNGAASTNGGAAYFRLFNGTSSGTAVTAYRLEHSADDSTYATLASSTLATTGAQRVAIAAGTTIERYVRLVITVASGKTATYNVALHRAA